MEERLGRFVAEMKPTREFLRLFLEGDRAAFQRLLSHPCVLGEGGKELERFAEVVRMWQVPEVEVAGVREMEQLGIRAERLVEEAERIFRNEVAIPERGEEGMIPEGVRFGVVRKRMCSGM